MKFEAKLIPTLAVLVVFLALGGCTATGPRTDEDTAVREGDTGSTVSDDELARLLVSLELRTRAVVASHYKAGDSERRAWMAKSRLLPAAVADGVFHEVVPAKTANRAWVKMVVDEPRNSNNRGDATALALLGKLREGTPSASQRLPNAYYYAEPITAAATCLVCHGEPADEPDPFFPEYKKDGWKDGDVVGAVVARVAGAD